MEFARLNHDFHVGQKCSICAGIGDELTVVGLCMGVAPAIRMSPPLSCENCGNEYDRLMRIETLDGSHFFDCFECAIQKLAPRCAHCRTRVIGHGLESNSTFYCCAHCARAEGEHGLRDSTNDLIEAA